MNRIGQFFLLLFFVLPLLVSGRQTEFTISGYVEDALSGEKLIGVNIYEPTLKLGASSNAYGFFSLTLPAGHVQIAVTYIGYQTFIKDFELNADSDLNVRLNPSTIKGDTIVVAAERYDAITKTTQMSAIEVPARQMRSLPALLGEVDVLKVIQLLPGVQSGSEGTSGIYVRGGGPDQNLLLIDDAPVYNASHLFGFFSVFNSDAVKKVTLTKGGFPARFGGRLSSVLEINTKDGNMKRISGQGSVGVIASRFTLEGPLQTDKTSFILSGRRTYLDLLMRPFMDSNEGVGGYYFYDFNAKVNHIFSGSDRLFFSLYMGDDRFYMEQHHSDNSDKFDLGWGNVTSTLRWNHILNRKMFSRTALIYSKYLFDLNSSNHGDGGSFFKAGYFSGVRDFGLKYDLDFLPGPRHYLRSGFNVIRHTYSPGAFHVKFIDESASAIDTTLAAAKDINAMEASFYLEDDFKLTADFTANLGLHLSAFNVRNKTYFSWQPRLSLNYLIFEKWALKSSFASMNQYVHLLTNGGIGMPTDLWVPATDAVPPQKSWQLSAGLARSFQKNAFEFSFEIYYKKMDNLIEYKEGAGFTGLDKSWESKIESGSGRAYGAELFLQKKAGKTSGWIGYTLSWSDRLFNNLNEGKRFPYKYDRRHDVSVAVVHAFTPKLELSASWVFGTGNAVTFPIGVYRGFEGALSYFDDIKLYSSRNGFRMPAYHRLDIALKFINHKSATKKSEWTIGLYNAYNHKNPYFIYIDEDWDTDKKQAKQVSLFPIIPALSYSFSF